MYTSNIKPESVNVTDTILLTDLGKFKSVACVYEKATAARRFTSFTTNRAELLKVIEQLQPGVVVIEACALAGGVRDVCTDRSARMRPR